MTPTESQFLQRIRRVCVGIVLIALAALTIVLIGGIVSGDFTGLPAMVTPGIALSLFLATILLASATVIDRGRHVRLMWFNVGLMIVTAALWVRVLLSPFGEAHGLFGWQTTMVFTIVVFAVACTGRMGLVDPVTRWQRRMRGGTLICIWLTAGVATWMIATEVTIQFMIWLVVTLGVVSVVGVVGVPRVVQLHSESPRRRVAAESFDRSEVLMTCPRCGALQRFRCGVASCAACGQVMDIAVSEPRCECGYLVYQLEGDACPECGRRVCKPIPVPITEGECPCGSSLALVEPDADACPSCQRRIPAVVPLP